ncbi:CDC27 protein [Microsporum ferrugineum]
MAADYRKFLAEKVFSDEEFVTYRALSRAQRVHSNQAKRMLYEFHRSENEKKPNSVHATYLLTGISGYIKPSPLGEHRLKDGEDEVMQSSPFMSSQPAQPEVVAPVNTSTVTSIMLVREEQLADAKNQLKKILSIFIYSVQPSSPPDLNILADIGQASSTTRIENPLQYSEQYGMIQNKNVKRRSGVPVTLPAPVKEEKAVLQSLTRKPAQEPLDKKAMPQSTDKKPEPSSTPFRTSGSSQATAKPSQGKPTLKRDSSSIFKAFAKTRPKQPKEEETDSTPNESQNTMLDDESEEEREDLFLDTGKRTNNKERELKKDREERLRKMMEDDDMPDAPESPSKEETPVESDKAPLTPTPAPSQKQETEPEPESSVPEKPSTGQRRRGRRQVMKKKVSKDAEGYLVTKEEPVWESFSEDEPEPPKRKLLPSSSAKSTKGGSKSSQGSIMSFFGKK